MQNVVFKALVVLACILQLKISAQTYGCKDVNALNYNSSVTDNDGSCMYAVTNYNPVLATNLNSTVKESSGLVILNGQLWTHNDSGNLNEIYQIDTVNGTVLRTLVIKNAINVDWESITQNDSVLFIGDFGNNGGNRTDLKILGISKKDITSHISDTVLANFINFSYADQTSFIPANNNNDFDCESFFYANDSLHLITKNWVNLQTKHYVLPALPGTHQAKLVESYNVDGLITDAAINDSGTVALLGYKNIGGGLYNCFVWLLYDYKNQMYFSGNKRRFEIGSALSIGQTEGIMLKNDNSGWISSESISSPFFNLSAKLHRFQLPKNYDITLSTSEFKASEHSEILIYPNRFGEQLVVNFVPHFLSSYYTITNAYGQIVLNGNLEKGSNTINTEQLSEGIYFFTVNGNSTKILK